MGLVRGESMCHRYSIHGYSQEIINNAPCLPLSIEDVPLPCKILLELLNCLAQKTEDQSQNTWIM
jgi:hypothetical protein